MILRLLFISLLVAAGGMFGFGCKTTKTAQAPKNPRKSASHAKKAESVSSNSVKDPIAKEDAGKRAEAMARFATGLSYDLNDKPDKALDEYYKSATLHPENQIFIVKTAQRLLQDKQTEKAIEILARAVNETEANSTVHALLARAYLQTGETNRAISASQTALKKLPDSITAYENLAEIYFQVGKPAEAIKLLEQAARQPKVEAAFLVNLAESYLKYLQLQPKEKESITSRALEVLNRAAEMKPRSPTLQQKIADAMNQFGERKKAAEIYVQLVEKYSDMPDLRLYRDMLREKLSNIYLASKENALAAEQLEALIRDNPTKYPQAYYILGTIAFEERKFDKAADYFNRMISTSPSGTEPEQAYYNLALAQINLDKVAEALATLQKAKDKFPQSFIGEFYTGLAHQRGKQYAEAVKSYIAAEVVAGATEPKRLDYMFYFQVGSCHERGGDYGQAEKYFQKALDLKPDDPETLNYLGYMWAEHDMNLEKAHDYIAKAVKQEPENAAFLDSLGWVLFKLNRAAEALQYLLQAVNLSKEPDPTVFDHVGDVYLALKDVQKAREYWQKSLDLESNDAIKKKLSLQL